MQENKSDKSTKWNKFLTKDSFVKIQNYWNKYYLIIKEGKVVGINSGGDEIACKIITAKESEVWETNFL